MRKILGAFLVIAALGGCAQLQRAEQFLSVTTASIANPVTRDRLYAIENGIVIVFAGLRAYKSACVAGNADVNCRANVKAIQVYTRRIPPLLTDLRRFVKNNDQVNAVVVYNALSGLLADVRVYTNKASIKLGAQ